MPIRQIEPLGMPHTTAKGARGRGLDDARLHPAQQLLQQRIPLQMAALVGHMPGLGRGGTGPAQRQGAQRLAFGAFQGLSQGLLAATLALPTQGLPGALQTGTGTGQGQLGPHQTALDQRAKVVGITTPPVAFGLGGLRQAAQIQGPQRRGHDARARGRAAALALGVLGKDQAGLDWG